jgi:hypothetical protein
MGDLLSKEEAKFAAGSLNDMFSTTNIAATFAQIEQLRKTFPHLFNPTNTADSKVARKQTLRFAAFLINDEVSFNGNYPAPKFRQWLKWLTWLDGQNGGTLKLNNANFKGTASQLILQVMAQALPPGGPPTPIQFSWSQDNTGKQFSVIATTNAGLRINLVSVNSSQVDVNSDDQDDV